MRAYVTVDLGFGDAGKGLVTDFLVRHTGARMVVRYNGGAQAGHNVVTPGGRHHTFAQFGSGTFVPGVRSFLSSNVVTHPAALLREELHLRSAGVTDAFERLRISEDALVITPYHQALNRLREIARGAARHGSCGVGVGEAVAHARALPDEVIRQRDLADGLALRRKLRRVREYTWAEVSTLDAYGPDVAIFEEELSDWIAEVRPVAALTADEDAWIPTEDSVVVFEGSQGVLLDEWHGFHPYVTWGSCTSAPALRLLPHDAEVRTIGILRTYAVRHGPGPLPTESADVADTPHDHNTFNTWQGEVRRGWFDGELARYAVEADGAIDALAITHLDWLPRIGAWPYRLGSALRHCQANEEDVIANIEEMVGKPVAIGSRGPSATHVFIRPGEVNRGADRHREVGRPERPAGLALSEHGALDLDSRNRERESGSPPVSGRKARGHAGAGRPHALHGQRPHSEQAR